MKLLIMNIQCTTLRIVAWYRNRKARILIERKSRIEDDIIQSCARRNQSVVDWKIAEANRACERIRLKTTPKRNSGAGFLGFSFPGKHPQHEPLNLLSRQR